MDRFLAASSGGFWDAFMEFVNWLCQPQYFLTLSTLAFVYMLWGYKQWTRPRIAIPIFILFCVFYFGSLADPDYRSIIVKPDNVPITMMVISVMFFIWIAFRRAAINDTRIEQGLPLMEEDKDDKVLVWPDLVYTELICLVAATAALT